MPMLIANRLGLWSRATAWLRETLAGLPSGYGDFDPLVFRAMPPF